MKSFPFILIRQVAWAPFRGMRNFGEPSWASQTAMCIKDESARSLPLQVSPLAPWASQDSHRCASCSEQTLVTGFSGCPKLLQSEAGPGTGDCLESVWDFRSHDLAGRLWDGTGV